MATFIKKDGQEVYAQVFEYATSSFIVAELHESPSGQVPNPRFATNAKLIAPTTPLGGTFTTLQAALDNAVGWSVFAVNVLPIPTFSQNNGDTDDVITILWDSTPGDIEIYNGATIVDTITNVSGSTTYVFTGEGSYSAKLKVGNERSVSSNLINIAAIAINNTSAYAIPSFASGSPLYYDAALNDYTINCIELNLTKVGSNYILKDLVADIWNSPSGLSVQIWNPTQIFKFYEVVKHNNNWYYANYTNSGQQPDISAAYTLTTIEKLYWIGTPGNDRSLAYSVNDLKNGINVNSYVGCEIQVMVGWIAQNDNILNWSQQMVYVPEGSPTSVFADGLYFNYPDTKTFDPNVRDFRFNHYLTPTILNKKADHVLAFDLSNAKETVEKTSYQNLGIHSRFATDPNYTYAHLPDGWWQLSPLNFPTVGYADFNNRWTAFKAEQGGLAAATQTIRNIFKNHIIDPYSGIAYAFINNELSYHLARENAETAAVLALCYADWKVYNTGMLVAWNDSVIDVNFAVAVDKIKAFADYSMTGNLDQLSANAQWIKAAPSTSFAAQLAISNNGEYYNDPLSDRSMYVAIIQSVFNTKFNPTQKNVLTTWRTLEAIVERLRLSYVFGYYKGRHVRSINKPAVSPHSLYNMGAAGAYFAQGVHPWDDPLTAVTDGDAMYPYAGASIYLDGNGEDVPFGTYDSVHTANPTINLDGVLDGLQSVYRRKDLLSGELQWADINDSGTWRTDANAFVVGAWQDKKPFAAYRRVGNEYLVFAFNNYSRITQDIQIRMKDANNADVLKTVRIRADRVSIIVF